MHGNPRVGREAGLGPGKASLDLCSFPPLCGGKVILVVSRIQAALPTRGWLGVGIPAIPQESGVLPRAKHLFSGKAPLNREVRPRALYS